MFDLFKHGISDYLDDPDSQFIMDEIQKKFECCGAYTFNDWNYNAYFKCSSGDVLACGVPYSCCKTVSHSKAMECTIRPKKIPVVPVTCHEKIRVGRSEKNFFK